MSRHWKPEGKETPLRLPSEAKRSLDELDDWILPQSYVPPAKRRKLPPGAVAGLVLVAALCIGAVLVIDRAFGRPDVFAEELESGAAAWDGVHAP